MCKSLPILSVMLLAIVALTYASDSPPVEGTDVVLQAATTTRPATVFWTTTTKGPPPTPFWTTTTTTKGPPPTPFWTTTTTTKGPPPTPFWTTTTTTKGPPPTPFWTTTTKKPPTTFWTTTTTTKGPPPTPFWTTTTKGPPPTPFWTTTTKGPPPTPFWTTTTKKPPTPFWTTTTKSKLRESRTMEDNKAYWPYYWQPLYMVKSLPLALRTTSEAAQQTDSTTTSTATQQTDSTTPSTVTSTSSEAATVKIEENMTSTVGKIKATTTRPRPSIAITTKRPRRTTTTRKPRPSISATAPIDCSSDIEFWPHPECEKYIWCNDGEQLTQKCSKGLFWNYQLEKCDWPATVPKDHCTNPPPVVNSVVTTTSTTPVPPRDCSTDIEFYAHPDCDKFIRCADGEPQTFVCPGNLYWDNDNEQCEWPKKVPTSDCIVPTKKRL